jgi:hypothetical protein
MQLVPAAAPLLDCEVARKRLRQNAKTLRASILATLMQPTAARAAALDHFVTLGIMIPGVSMMYVGGDCKLCERQG